MKKSIAVPHPAPRPTTRTSPNVGGTVDGPAASKNVGGPLSGPAPSINMRPRVNGPAPSSNMVRR